MATYKIKGKRHLRKYTAPALTPVYGVSGAVATMAANLCECPWEPVEPLDACFPSHAEASLDCNVAARDFFDAAAFCAGHADGLHRVYGQAACYVFTLPDEAEGVCLTSLSVPVYSDPYNAGGIRLAVHTASTLEIPTDCAIARTGLAHVDGVAPRTSSTSESGAQTWTGAHATVTISPASAITLQKYLMVVVALESFVGRAGYAEGAAYAMNTFSITTSNAISADGWTDGNTAPIDCTADAAPAGHLVAEAGNYPRLTGETTGVFATMRHLNGDAVPFGSPPEVAAGDVAAGRNALYADLIKQRLDPIPAAMLANGGVRPGAGFTVFRRTAAELPSDTLGDTITTPRWDLAVAVLSLPFVIPAGGKSIELEWTAPTPAAGLVRLWLRQGELDESPDPAALSAPTLFTGAETTVGGYVLVATAPASAGALSAPIPAPPSAPAPATLLVTAYAPPESIALDSADTAMGVAALSADAPMGAVSGLDTLITPTITVTMQ